jgi:UDP-glucuronate decarboxylase
LKNRKTIAVTGGAGFLGSHLCVALLDEGHDVVAIDNFQTGRRENFAGLAGTHRLSIVEHDITNPLPDNLPRFDEIYNLACPASPVHYQADPLHTLMTCSQGIINVIDRVARDGSTLLHASTSEIYGDPEVHPQTEDYFGNVNTLGPRACYDEGKRFAETLLTDFARRSSAPVRIARIFNTYGPRMQPDDGRVVSNFVIQALKGEDITLYGDGSQTRSFCYVDDLIDGFLRLTRSEQAIPGPINLGNPNEITVQVLAHRIVEMTGSTSKLNYLALPVDDPRRRRPDITKAMSLLGWQPRVNLEDGLSRTIEYFSNNLTTHLAANANDRPPLYAAV